MCGMVLNLELALTMAKMEGYCFRANSGCPDPPPFFIREFRLVHLFLTLIMETRMFKTGKVLMCPSIKT